MHTVVLLIVIKHNHDMELWCMCINQVALVCKYQDLRSNTYVDYFRLQVFPASPQLYQQYHVRHLCKY